MVVRYVFSFAVLVVAVSVAGCGWAQVASEGPMTKVDADENTAAEETESAEEPSIDDIFGPIDEEQPEPAEETGPEFAGAEPPAADDAMTTEENLALDTEAANTESVDHTVARAAAPTAAELKVEELTNRVAAMQTEIEELKTNLYNLQQALAQAQDPSEFSQRALGAMALDPDLRGTMGQMLQGKVRLVNNTGAPAVVYINGTPWTVVTGDSYVLAPVGKVSFLKQGETEATFKDIQEWTENEQNGQFELEYRLGDTASERSVLMKLPAR